MKDISSLFILLLLTASCSKSAGDLTNTKGNTPNTSEQLDQGEVTTNGENDPNTEISETSLNDITSDFKTLMSDYNIPGAQIAITRNEKLVYLESFGMADLENEIKVDEKSLFRIASISKPITLMAISKLVLENKLKLNEFVFGNGAILGNEYGKLPYEAWEESINISHLLEHKSGFTNDPYDIMFDDVALSHTDLIGKVLDERSLTFQPGTQYEYSNFGYSLLGRIIEKVTGMTYEEYVNNVILKPMGITDMKIGGNTKEEALEGEVVYYSNWFSPYDMNVTRMDSHGGWIASAKSLALLAVQSDTRTAYPDLFRRGEGLDYLISGHWNHNGALPGTITVLYVGSPVSYTVLMNKGDANFQEMIQIIRGFMDRKISDRESWPSIDLFNFFPKN
ncbi:CubicO group peptidase (beta-lactamase class C family) [Saonia flava]|uniref:CubicO group peptidase (Beta-lactamase class C family) n=1 Tax=Saonia flava TaxID=523696 RepID=A0A846R772_9FLAO|nr:serine hydrolase domain-containing protein [Saonia flava]NJB72619.1 CubicO group peptidase (beta-lactamase class C family) [Saonia flava]